MTSIVGTERIGDVYLWEFDKGIFDQLQTILIGDHVYLPLSKVPGMKAPLFDENHGVPEEVGKEMPGIPVLFANPDDSIQRYDVPCVRIVREDPSPALERWMSLHLKYKGPAPGAQPVQVQYNNALTLNGFDKYEEQAGA